MGGFPTSSGVRVSCRDPGQDPQVRRDLPSQARALVIRDTPVHATARHTPESAFSVLYLISLGGSFDVARPTGSEAGQ